MAAIASGANGVWSATGTWTGGVVPVEGTDTVTITHQVEIDGNQGAGTDTATAAVAVKSGGKLFVPGATVAAAYTFTVSGDIVLGDGSSVGTIELGTPANPIPVGKEFVLTLNKSATPADGKYGLISFAGSASVLTMQGASKTFDRTLLAANNGGTCSTSGTTVTRLEGTGFTGKTGTMTINGVDYTISSVTNDNTLVLTATAGTQSTSAYIFQSDNNALTTADSTAWADNDLCAIASTDRTPGHCEKFRLNGAASGTAITLDGGDASDGGLKWGHLGASPMQAEVINLTRTVHVTSYTSTAMTYISLSSASTTDFDWVEFSYMGTNSSTKRGIECLVTTGSVNINRCSLHDFEYSGLYEGSTSFNNATWTNNVFWNCSNSGGGPVVGVAAVTTGTSITITGNLVMYAPAGSATGFQLSDVGCTFTNNIAVGIGSNGFNFAEAAPANVGTFSGLTAHSCGSIGVACASSGTAISSVTAWRNVGGGLGIGSARNSSVTTATMWGNSSGGIYVSGSAYNFVCQDVTTAGDTVFSTPAGIYSNVGSVHSLVYCENCDFGTVTGIRNAHTTADIQISGGGSVHRWIFRNCVLASATETSTSGWTGGGTVGDDGSVISIQRKDQTDDSHKTITPRGTIEYDGSTGNPAAPSIKLTPTQASRKLECVIAVPKVADGGTATVSADVLETAAYNGNAPRLRYRRDTALGYTADATLDTHGMVDDAWETLTGTTAAAQDDGAVEVYVDCDGTAGIVRIDNIVIG